MPGAPRPSFHAKLLSPVQWPAWLGVGILKLVARLPRQALMAVGRGLGVLIQHFPSRRRHIAEVNIALCFPELSAAERAALVDAHLRDIGLMMMEFALGWMGTERAIERVPVTLEGLEHLEAARAQGKGVLLVGGHFSHLELCARLVSRHIRIAGMYRRMDSAVFEWAVLRARLDYAAAMFDKDDIRGTVSTCATAARCGTRPTRTCAARTTSSYRSSACRRRPSPRRITWPASPVRWWFRSSIAACPTAAAMHCAWVRRCRTSPAATPRSTPHA